MTIDLLFLQARQTAPPIHLVFGDTADAPSVDVTLDADLGDVTLQVLVVSMAAVSMEADFGQLQFDALAIPIITTLNDLLFRRTPLTAPPVDLLFETMH